MDHDDARVNYWSVSYTRLARECGLIAEDDSPAIDPALKEEAGRLLAAWKECLALPEDGFDEGARRAALLRALRKRTIAILVNTHLVK